MAIAMPSITHRPRRAEPWRSPAAARAELRHGRDDARYRRRRAGVALAVAALVGGGALVADTILTGPGGVPASAAGAGTEQVRSGRVVRADPGDSLWSIAEDHHGDVPIGRYVEALIDLNGGTGIEVGQLVRLP